MSEIPAPEDALPVQGKTKRAALVLGALGIVFGDIGTSPLYALRECFAPERGMAANAENVLGVVSLLFWTLSLVVCVKYLVFVLRADNKGEGGILALVSLVSSKVREANKAKAAGLLAALAILGAALLYSDGIITPSISVLSAVEGLEILAPGLKTWVAPIAIVILFCLFPLQSKGTAGVARLFGPLLALWFAVIGLLGLSAVISRPAILQALSPVWAVRLLLREGPLSFGILGSVFLAMTGAEVLYADLGHFGPRPIRQAWFSLVYPALFLNYMGQGAYLLGHPGEVANLFYRLAPSWATIPLVVLATAATVIASQAVISGSFSLASQSVQLGYWPRIEVRHTSKDRIGQVYVPFINAFLMVGTIGLVLIFKESGRLANAYGIAVSATMLITTFLMIYVATHIWKMKPLAVLPFALVFLVIDAGFFVSNATKIVSGGWIVVALALAFFLLMKTWQDGRALFRRRMQVFRVEPRIFADSLALEPPLRVPGSAVFLTGDPNGVPKALLHNLKHNRVLHELTVIASIRNVEQPFVDEVARVRKAELSPGLWHLVIDYGFSETPDIPAALSKAKVPGLDPMRSAYFVGRESLALKKKGGGMAFWRKRLFDFMFENALDATAFFHLPPNNVIEIGSQTVL